MRCVVVLARDFARPKDTSIITAIIRKVLIAPRGIHERQGLLTK